MARRIREALLDEWLDSPIGPLGDKSPREAARDPALREKLDELLKAFEYVEEQKRRDGEPDFDLDGVRRKLGLTT